VLLIELKKVSAIAVHFVLPSDLVGDFGELAELEVVETSIEEIMSDKELFAKISMALKFPDYFGCNWDAVDECLTDMNWLPANGYILILKDATQGWSQTPYALGRLVTAWLEAAEYWAENKTPFHLVFVM
jgi:RNAse (barnase) inhibitor barstar